MESWIMSLDLVKICKRKTASVIALHSCLFILYLFCLLNTYSFISFILVREFPHKSLVSVTKNNDHIKKNKC